MHVHNHTRDRIHMYMNVFIIAGMSTIFTLMALSVQRCLYVWFPTTMGVVTGTPYTYTALIFVWAMTCSFAFPPLMGWSEYVPEKSGIRYEKCMVHEVTFSKLFFCFFQLQRGF